MKLPGVPVLVRASVVAIVLQRAATLITGDDAAPIVATVAATYLLDHALKVARAWLIEWHAEQTHWERQRSEAFRPENKEAR